MDGPQPMNISTAFAPIQIDANYGLLLGAEKSVKYYQWHPATNRRCVINVLNAQNTVRFSVRLTSDSIVVNKKIRVHPNGTVEHRNTPVQNEISSPEVTFKVDTEQTFNITIFAFEQNFTFAILPDTIECLPPHHTPVECPICYNNMIKAEVKITRCGHIFCTGCIVRALTNKNTCPVCRKNVSLADLGNIYLHI